MNEKLLQELSRQQVQQIDAVVSQFESDLTTGRQTAMETLLQTVSEEVRPALLAEMVSTEIDFRKSRGQAPDADAYISRFPHHSQIISAVFATVTAPNQTVVTNATDSSSDVEAVVTQGMSTDETDSFFHPTAPAVETRIAQKSAGTHAVEIPKQFGRYTIERVLGTGGMGTVYLAEDIQLKRRVAIKIPKFSDYDRNGAERFLREARAMATVEHPNLCPVHDVGEIDGQNFLTMAYIDGPTLAEVVEQQGELPIADAIDLTIRLADAVQAAHSEGVIHRDLKPANIIVNEGTEPVVMDFGLARTSEAQDSTLTQEGMIIGSPAYMAPEQVDATVELIGPQTDVYALGVILYEMLCGQRPYRGSALSVLAQVKTGERPLLRDIRSTIDSNLEGICERAMASDSGKRYASASEFAEALRAYVPEVSPKTHSSGISKRVLSAIIGLAPLVASAVFLVNTPTGSLKVTAPEGAEVTLEILRDGKVVSAVNGSSGWTANIDEGEYRLSLKPANPEDEFGFEITGSDKLNIARGKDSVVVIEAVVATKTRTPAAAIVQPFAEIDQQLAVEGAMSAATGDIDNDGDADLIFISNQMKSGQIWLNDGEGQFEWQSDFFPKAWRIALADLDDDDDLDVWLLGGGEPDHVFLNDGTGAFTEVPIESSEGSSFGAAIADFDGDGDVDVLVAKGVFANNFETPRHNVLYLNDGHGRFTDSGQKMGSASSGACVAVDIDADGDQDVCIGNTTGQPCRVWKNDGKGLFSAGQKLAKNGRGLTFGDVDLDGDPDLVIACGIGPNTVWLNDGKGGFSDSGQEFDGLSARNVSLFDVDHDGDLDAVLANQFRDRANGQYGPASNAVWWNDGSGQFLSSASLPGKRQTVALLSADFNGDGNIDLIDVPRLGQDCSLQLNQFKVDSRD